MAAKKAAKKVAAPKAPKAAKKKAGKHAFFGGWNKARTALLMYDANGTWSGKLSAASVVDRAAEFQPLSKLNAARHAVPLAEIKARAAELAKK